MPDQHPTVTPKSPHQPPELTRHGKLGEVTQTSPPDALDSTTGPGERPVRTE